jgi:hypothetical protein
MWILLFVVLLGILAALWVLMTLNSSQHDYANMNAQDMVRTAAQQALAVMQQCQLQASGTYTTSALMSFGFPSELPAGASWVCKVTAGGSNSQGNVAVLYVNGPATHWSTHGSQPAANGGNNPLQQQYAWLIAGQMAAMLKEQGGNWIAGEVDAGDPTPNLNPVGGGPQINLSGDMPANLGYATPALVSGVVASGF